MEIIRIRLKSFFVKLAVAVTAVFLIMMREDIGDKISDALTMCGDTLIPTLFPFMVLSSFALSYGIFEKETKIASFVMNRIFRLPIAAVSAVIFGFAGGYPVGARVICKLYEKGSISREDAKHLFAFCINGGPAFIISFAGEIISGSEDVGYIIFVSVFISSLMTGIVYSRIKKKNSIAELKTDRTDQSISSSVVFSVTDATGGIISVCAWVIMFMVFSAVVAYFVNNEMLLKIYLSVAEITSGLEYSLSVGGIPFAAACIASGGISVFCQVLPAIKKCGIKVYEYLFFRIINSITVYCVTSLLIKIFDVTIPVVSEFDAQLHFAPASAALLIMCAVLIFDVVSDNERQNIFG